MLTENGQNNSLLTQKLHGIFFKNPIGLAAGFDYDAHLIQVAARIGFGLTTVGTVTNLYYGGNPPPIMGRLPKSQSLMVYKGFKSSGADVISSRLSGQTFSLPVGISIGRSNNRSLISEKESITDIIACFQKFEEGNIKHSYYELNISCPNLFGTVTFYPPKHLKMLLEEVEKLHLRRPIFIKMPIDRTDSQIRSMLNVIINYTIAGVIFGNLQKDRKNSVLVQEEVAKFPRGNFSGKPTWQRSNELISLAFREYGKKLTIIGCGGVFSAEDAYTKILLGSSLVQLITGMIYSGPQLITQINMTLPEFLKRDGFVSIKEAVGKGNAAFSSISAMIHT